jgi:hypothetical protein
MMMGFPRLCRETTAGDRPAGSYDWAPLPLPLPLLCSPS